MQTNIQSFNNLTGDILLSPQSFGLFMRDIEAASLNLKTAIYNGNVNLTADLYKQLETLSSKKYNAINTDGSIDTTRLSDTDMIGKDAGLYMNHQRMGFWDGDEWMAVIGNTGEMWLGNVIGTNYLYWDGINLNIKGNLMLSSGETVEDALDSIDVSWDGLGATRPSVLIDAANSGITPPVTGSGLKITSTHMGYYSGGQRKTFMRNNGDFRLSGSGSNSLEWNGSTLNINGAITATSGSFTGSVSVSNTGNFYGGKTTYGSTTAGFWLGYDSSAYKFKLGNSDNSIDWDGSSLNIIGNITLTNTIPNTSVSGLGSFSTISTYGEIPGSKPPVNADVTLSAIQGSLVLAGGGLVLHSGGASIRGGMTGYNTGTGFWLGDDGGVTRLSIGNSSGNKITWDGIDLNITGSINMTGGSISWSYITGAPTIPTLPGYITSTKITATTIESPVITAGSITGTTINTANNNSSDRVELINNRIKFFNGTTEAGSIGPGGLFSLTGIAIDGDITFRENKTFYASSGTKIVTTGLTTFLELNNRKVLNATEITATSSSTIQVNSRVQLKSCNVTGITTHGGLYLAGASGIFGQIYFSSTGTLLYKTPGGTVRTISYT